MFKSRKFIYGMIGMISCLFLYFVNLVLVTIFVESQASYISLFNTVIMFISGIIAGLMGIHGWMDHKTTAASIINNTFSKEEKDIKEERVNIDANIVAKYAQKYKNDPSYAPIEFITKQES
jgi:uncharacterized protein YacL